MIAETGYTTDQAAEALGCARASTTRRLEKFDARLELIARALMALAPTDNAENIARMIVSTLETGGRLAMLDRKTMSDYARRTVERLRASTPD